MLIVIERDFYIKIGFYYMRNFPVQTDTAQQKIIKYRLLHEKR